MGGAKKPVVVPASPMKVKTRRLKAESGTYHARCDSCIVLSSSGVIRVETAKDGDSGIKLIVGKVYRVQSATGHHDMTYVGKSFTGKHTFQHSNGEFAF